MEKQIQESTINLARINLNAAEQALFSIRSLKEAILGIQNEREGMDHEAPYYPTEINDDTLSGLIQAIEYPVLSALAALDEISNGLHSLAGQKKVEV
ncbi:MAG: hypothetical protein ACYDBT_09985 [Desulfobulbaceae bacterium]